MKRIPTHKLIKKIAKYEFFDWEWEREVTSSKILGMSQLYLSEHKVIDNLYNSWGYDAVSNKHAEPKFSKKEWRYFEEVFFAWLKQLMAKLIAKNELIVTPDLTVDWLIYDWQTKSKWINKQYETYVELLTSNNIIATYPRFKNDYRGATVESFNEFQLLAQMAIKGSSLMFFIDNHIVFRITEYLTIQIFYRNKDDLKLFNRLDSQVLD